MTYNSPISWYRSNIYLYLFLIIQVCIPKWLLLIVKDKVESSTLSQCSLYNETATNSSRTYINSVMPLYVSLRYVFRVWEIQSLENARYHSFLFPKHTKEIGDKRGKKKILQRLFQRVCGKMKLIFTAFFQVQINPSWHG